MSRRPSPRRCYEMELPRSAGDAAAATAPGALLALADRFDLLAGLFAIGAKPTGSSDPFGLRRAALGVVAILREHPDAAGVTLRDRPGGGRRGRSRPRASRYRRNRWRRSPSSPSAGTSSSCSTRDDHHLVAGGAAAGDGPGSRRRDAGRRCRSWSAAGLRRRWSRRCSGYAGSCRRAPTATYDAAQADRAGRGRPARGGPEGRPGADRAGRRSSPPRRRWSSRSTPSSTRSW